MKTKILGLFALVIACAACDRSRPPPPAARPIHTHTQVEQEHTPNRLKAEPASSADRI